MRLAEIAGQPRVVEILTRALETGRLAHAYLFEGIAGCGKMTTALALMEAVFCGKPAACGECSSCKKMRALQHPDLHIVEPDGQSIKIDQIRELQKALSYRPFEAPKKGCIINQADKMNPAAANALLKTLEEPPGDALLILITENREALLPTVLSRCQPLQLAPLSEVVVQQLLQREGWTEERASIGAAMADGSLTAARRLADETASVERGALLHEILALSPNDAAPLLSLAERLAPSKEQAVTVTDTLLALFRDMVLLKAGDDRISNADLMTELRAAAEIRPLHLLVRGTEAVSDIRKTLLRNANPRLAMEVLFMRLAEIH